jgi:murein DD-endopeptidase MepM/ murein hydrolase activator NlpD
VADEGDLQDQRDGAARRLKRAEQQVGESSDRLRAASERLQEALAQLRVAKATLVELDAKVIAARARDDALRADLSEAEFGLREARGALTAAVAGVVARKQTVVDTVVGLYQGEDAGLLSLRSFLDSALTEELARRQSAVEALLGKQTRAYEDLRSTRVLAEVGEEQVEERTREVAARRGAAAAGLRDLQDARREARWAAREVQLSVEDRRQSRLRAARVRTRDLAVLRRAEANDARIRERIREAARRQAAEARRSSGSSSRARAGGFLVPPVAGTVSSPFGYRVHPILQYWGLRDGVDYASACGGALWAGADGVVTSTYYSNVYAYRLFVNVGTAGSTGITLVYNHAAGYASMSRTASRRTAHRLCGRHGMVNGLSFALHGSC